MPNIQEILLAQSAWTYDTIAGSAVLGEVIREDALTSVNLVSINNMARMNDVPIPISITSMQGAKLEQEFGADWMWTLDPFSYLVQAKKLDAARRPDLMSYTIDVPQLLNLQAQADTMARFYRRDIQPIYVFYNGMLPPEYGKDDWGCTATQSEALINYLEETGQIANELATVRFNDIKARMIPWYRLFGGGGGLSGAFGAPGSAQTSATVQPASKMQSSPFSSKPRTLGWPD
jgi:hypothetical protein